MLEDCRKRRKQIQSQLRWNSLSRAYHILEKWLAHAVYDTQMTSPKQWLIGLGMGARVSDICVFLSVCQTLF